MSSPPLFPGVSFVIFPAVEWSVPFTIIAAESKMAWCWYHFSPTIVDALISLFCNKLIKVLSRLLGFKVGIPFVHQVLRLVSRRLTVDNELIRGIPLGVFGFSVPNAIVVTFNAGHCPDGLTHDVRNVGPSQDNVIRAIHKRTSEPNFLLVNS